MRKELITDENGNQRWNYITEDSDAGPDGLHRVVTTGGNVSGPAQLNDGTVYDLSEDYLAVPSDEHHDAVLHHIEVRHQKAVARGEAWAVALHGSEFTPTHQDNTQPAGQPSA